MVQSLLKWPAILIFSGNYLNTKSNKSEIPFSLLIWEKQLPIVRPKEVFEMNFDIYHKITQTNSNYMG